MEPVKAAKPYYEMSLEDYAATSHSQSVPRWSILALCPDTYTLTELCRHGRESLSAMAKLWGVKREGTKQEIANRIIRRVQFRSMMARETEASLASRRRKDLAAIATEAGIYHPWLNRKELARLLIGWREDARQNARFEIARAHHECLVQSAARKGLRVPQDNLLRYGLDQHGREEPTILGEPMSRVARVCPDALEAAKTLSHSAFHDWVQANRGLSGKLVFLQPGILGDGGSLFWREVQRAFAVPDMPPLFKGMAMTNIRSDASMSDIRNRQLLDNYIAALNAGKATCQEASPLSHTTYIPCGAPAMAIVDNGDPGWYFMCGECADHNVKNRAGRILYRLSSVHPARAADNGGEGVAP